MHQAEYGCLALKEIISQNDLYLVNLSSKRISFCVMQKSVPSLCFHDKNYSHKYKFEKFGETFILNCWT